MRLGLETFWVIVEISVRNLSASRWKSLIVGGITGFGALLIVLGTSLLDSIDHAMQRSVTGSVSGHVQVYSADAKDELEIFGNFYVDIPDLGSLPDFAKLQHTLLAVPNVAAVVPMSFSDAVASSGSLIDQVLEDLRRTIEERARDGGNAALVKRYTALKARVREISRLLRHEIDDAKKVSEAKVAPEELAALERATSDEFWADFDRDPPAGVEFIESHVSPFSAEGDVLFLRYIGTDPAAFARTFDRMRIVDGTTIPPGERGFLFSKYMYEEQAKLKAARGLDYIKAAREERYAKIATDPDLQRVVDENSSGVNELLMQLDAEKMASFRSQLQVFLKSRETDVGQLLASFFTTTDANFDERYAFFYRALAPQLKLYTVGVGDSIAMRTISRAGYVQTVNLKVYGTFVFDGLEKSPQAGSINIVDMVSFRELYGFMTADKERELADIRTAAGATDVGRDDAEAALFGEKHEVETEQVDHADRAGDSMRHMAGTRSRLEGIEHGKYDPKQLQQGVVLGAGIMLTDPDRSDETMQAIEHAAARAGIKLKVVSWQKASGVLGQFATLTRGVLFAAVLIIFVVALVVINNALVVATLDRVGEIGTLRAIGAQRRFILGMLLIESAVIGLFSGGLGALAGTVLLFVLNKVGIPAWSEVSSFYFAGPRLFPEIEPLQLFFALITIVLISLVSGVYPAWLAMRVTPREAMHAED